MSASNFSRIVRGPAYPFRAAASTAPWTPAAGNPSGWTRMASGLVSPEGITISLQQDVSELQVADKAAPVAAYRTSQRIEISFTTYDLDPRVFADYAGNTATAKELDFTQGFDVSQFALLIVGQSPTDITKRCGWWFPRVYISEIGGITTARRQVLQAEITCRALYDSSRGAVMKYSVQA